MEAADCGSCFCEMLCNLHRAVESLAVDGLVHEAPSFRFMRREGHSHEDVHERSRGSDGSRQPLRAAGAGKESNHRFRRSDLVVAILGDAKVAGEREFESAGQAGAGNGGDDRFRHALAQSHGLVEEPAVVGSVVGPLAA